MSEPCKNADVSHPILANKRRRVVLWISLALIAVILYLQTPCAASVKYSMELLNQHTEACGDFPVFRHYDNDDLYIWRLKVADGVSPEELLQTGRWRRHLLPPLFESWSVCIDVADNNVILLYPGQNIIVVHDEYSFPSDAYYIVNDDLMEDLLQLLTPSPQDTVNIDSYQRVSQYI